MEKMILVVLDKPTDFPYLKNFIKQEIYFKYEDPYIIKWENDLEKLKVMAMEYYEEHTSSLPIFSFDTALMNKVLNSIDSVTPFFITIEKGEFKEIYEEFKQVNIDKFTPRIMISSTKETDLLEVSNLFSKSNQRKLKYINGDTIPLIIDYEGMETFNFINTLKSGVMVPATDYDIECLNDPESVVSKKNLILQIDEVNKYICSISYTLYSNKSLGLIWTEIETVDNEEITDLVKQFVFPESMSCNIYLELEKHKDTLFINKVIQGIHPYVYHDH
jgi:CO dehydrogenase/acetyl-CoA synthase gamma subunit (corrinoid Fe-S protein)